MTGKCGPALARQKRNADLALVTGGWAIFIVNEQVCETKKPPTLFPLAFDMKHMERTIAILFVNI